MASLQFWAPYLLSDVEKATLKVGQWTVNFMYTQIVSGGRAAGCEGEAMIAYDLRVVGSFSD